MGKMFKYIYKVFVDAFRKYCALCTSELSLSKFQCLGIHDFGIPSLTQKFFRYLSTISDEQLSLKPINHIFLCKNSIIPAMCT